MRKLTSLTAAAILTLGLVAHASAAAIVIRDTITSDFSESDVPHDGLPGITGDVEGTEVTSFQSVETVAGFHVAGTIDFSGRIDWSDGTHSIIESIDHFSFNAGKGTEVFTLAHEDSGNTYTADGAFLRRITFHLIEHITVTDGVIRAEFERGHFHFFGDC